MESLVNNKALLVLYKNGFCYSMGQSFLKLSSLSCITKNVCFLSQESNPTL